MLTVVAQRRSVSSLSTITNQGKVRFMVLQGPLSAATLIRFLQRLIRDRGRKVFVILDNLTVHRAAKAYGWVGEHRDEIEVFDCRPTPPS